MTYLYAKTFWPRALLKGPKRSFVVLVLVVLVVGVETFCLNVLNGTKSVQANKKCAREQKMCKGTKNVPKSQNEVHKVPIVMGAKCYILWVTHYGIKLPCLPFMDGFMWPCMVLYGLVWPYVALYGFIAFVWPSVLLCGILWPSYGFLSQFMVCLWSLMAEYRLSRGHRSKFIWSCLDKSLLQIVLNI